MPNHQQNYVLIKRNRPLLLMAAVSAYLLHAGGGGVLKWFREGYCFTPWGIVATTICGHWLMSVLFLGTCALVSGSQRLLLDDWGVHCGRIFLKPRLSWQQICDWGICCNRGTSWEGKMIHLYFSPRPLTVHERAGKKFSKQIVRIFLLERDWERLKPTVLSYCKERLENEPFDGTDEPDMCGGVE